MRKEKGMNIRSFAEVIADTQGGIHIKPGHSRSHVLTRERVMEIFGEIPECSIQYGYTVSVSKLENDIYRVIVRREKE